MKSQKITGNVKFDNYSQTQVRITVYDEYNYPYAEYFFDKKTLTFDLPVLASDPTSYHTFSMVQSGAITYYFTIGQIIFPVVSYIPELLNILNSWIYGEGMSVSLNGGTPLDPLRTLNLIEGSNITITQFYNPSNNTIDVTIDSSGGGGGLPPDGTYGDVVVSGAGTIWTVTDDTSNQQVAVYEDSFLRGTRPAINFYDNGAAVNVTVTDNPGNNWVDVLIAYTPPSPTYLVAYDTNSQTATSPNRGYAMTFDTTVESSNISFATSSAVRFIESGVYNVQFSAQFANYDTQDHDVDIWFVLNGSMINWSNSRFSIIGTHGGINGHQIAAWNYMSTFNVNDELEIYWQTDDIQVQLEKIPPSGDAPETPSIILTIDKL